MKKKLRLSFVIVCILYLSITSAYALEYTGYTALHTSEIWSSDSTFCFEVDDFTDPNYWTYSYTFTGIKEKNNEPQDISHIIIEVSDGFLSESIKDIIDGDDTYVESYELKPYSSASSSNPDMPEEGIYGIKWDTANDPEVFSFWIVSDRSPMWGDVYGKAAQSGIYNVGFGDEPDPLYPDSDFVNADTYDYALVPDTMSSTPIPEPTTMVLLGSGLLGLVGLSMRKLLKNS